MKIEIRGFFFTDLLRPNQRPVWFYSPACQSTALSSSAQHLFCMEPLDSKTSETWSNPLPIILLHKAFWILDSYFTIFWLLWRPIKNIWVCYLVSERCDLTNSWFGLNMTPTMPLLIVTHMGKVGVFNIEPTFNSAVTSSFFSKIKRPISFRFVTPILKIIKLWHLVVIIGSVYWMVQYRLVTLL